MQLRSWKLIHVSTVVLAVCAVVGTLISSCQLQSQINRLAAALPTQQSIAQENLSRDDLGGDRGIDKIRWDGGSRRSAAMAPGSDDVDASVVVRDAAAEHAIAKLVEMGIVARTDEGKYRVTASQPRQALATSESVLQWNSSVLKQEIVALLSHYEDGRDISDIFADLSKAGTVVPWKAFNLAVNELAAAGIVRQTEEGSLVTPIQD